MRRFVCSLYRTPGRDTDVTLQITYRWMTGDGWRERTVLEVTHELGPGRRTADDVVCQALLAGLIAMERELDATA